MVKQEFYEERLRFDLAFPVLHKIGGNVSEKQNTNVLFRQESIILFY